MIAACLYHVRVQARGQDRGASLARVAGDYGMAHERVGTARGRAAGRLAVRPRSYSAQFGVLPMAKARAQEGSRAETYRLLNLFGDVFERMRAEYVEPVNDREADRERDQRHADRRSTRTAPT